MAARTSTSVGMGITVAALGITSVACLVLMGVFFSQRQDARRQVRQLEENQRTWIGGATDEIRNLEGPATQARQSVLTYLNESYKTLSSRVTGTAGEPVTRVVERIQAATGEDGGTLLGVLGNRQREIAALEQRLEQAEAARQAALADLQAAVDASSSTEASFRQTIAALTSEMEGYKAELDQYRAGLESSYTDRVAQVERDLTEARDQAAELTDQLSSQQEELLVAREQLKLLRAARSQESLRPTDPFALVDGEVIAVNPGDAQVFINRGRKDKMVLGTTFEVYADASAVKPDPRTGEYPRGKASIEVVRVDETSSTARIVRNPRGNPVVRGDVIVNAIYDPTKVYTMLVFGNFDVNGDGVATPEGRLDIRALVSEWGGRVTDTLTGDVDFLVLGRRPVLPPAPPPDAPVAAVQEYIRQRRIVQEYDRLFEQATATSIPVLSENRLYTLIGKVEGN